MQKNRFLIYLTVFLIMGLSNSVIPVLPEIAAEGLTEPGTLLYTLLFSGYFIGALLTMIPFGFIADRYDRTKLIVLAIFFTFFSGIILVIVDNIYLLICARLIEGIACGAFFPPAYAILSGFNEKKRYIGEFNFLLNAGLACGVLASGFLAELSIKGAITLFTIISVIILLIGIYIIVKDNNPPEIAIQDTRKISPVKETKKALRKILDMRFIRIWITAFLLFGVSGVMLAFYPDYSKDMLNKAELGIAIAILYVSSMTTNIVVGRMNLNFRHMIFTGVLTAAMGILISVRFPFLGFALLGIGSGTGMIGLPVAVSHMSFNKGLAMGIFTTYTYAGLAFMPMITGLFAGLGYPSLFIITAFSMILSLFLRDGIVIRK